MSAVINASVIALLMTTPCHSAVALGQAETIVSQCPLPALQGPPEPLAPRQVAKPHKHKASAHKAHKKRAKHKKRKRR